MLDNRRRAALFFLALFIAANLLAPLSPLRIYVVVVLCEIKRCLSISPVLICRACFTFDVIAQNNYFLRFQR